ncbi:sulfotransferase [Aureitalea marina]|uniref:Uncharacterized protein n=1 Tax=Aureitalea marina TaxID=930804 RepID=A0A2S7KMM7_9FLAO|nr:sulfotransferase [Aureitalea marina]PQB03886.1 hypothetical protein BST85_02415 [Aureitalea marina]
MKERKVILVTGSNRSGSTWVGRVLASNGKVDTIIEPLNVNRVQRFGHYDINTWYPTINSDSTESLIREIHKLYADYLNTSIIGSFRDFFKSYEGFGPLISLKKRLRRASKPVKMLKDPMAIFLVPWLVEQFAVIPVILIRHPAAYVLSIKEKGWKFDFQNLLEQPNFFNGGMDQLESEVRAHQNSRNDSLIDNAALFWKVCYTKVQLYQRDHPQWHYVRHEDLSHEPAAQFQRMFAYLQLDYNQAVRDYIRNSTSVQDNKSDQYLRNSKKNAEKWKYLLNAEEIERIYAITASVSNHFYPDFSV